MTAGIPQYNVSELTYLIKNTLEDKFPVVRVQGEISNFRPAASGHCYFNLKDKDAVISAVLFRQQRNRLDFIPADGQSVSVLGRVTVYPQRGNYQIICESMEQAGRGDLLYQLEMLKKRLQAEGLFDADRKLPLPDYPQRIAVVTSSRGAALQDIIQILQRRMKSFRLSVYDALVQGDGSPLSIVRALKSVDREADVIILARGGGSLEDLISFSDERVVRAVAASPIPIVCGVGHEIDYSLSDFAADVRAATPSAAAEIVSQKTVEASGKVHQMRSLLKHSMIHFLERQRWKLGSYDVSALRMSILSGLALKQQSVDLWRLETRKQLSDHIRESGHLLNVCREIINSSSPDHILARGYALVRHNKKVIKSSEELNKGDLVSLQFSDGEKQAEIQGEEIDI